MSDRGGRGRIRGRGNVMGRGRVQADQTELVRGRGRGRGTPRIPANVADDFVQATSSNLPTVNFMNVANYFQRLRAPELRHAKDSR